MSLGARVRPALGWSLANNVAARLGNFVAGVVLARLLVPEDYGVFAIGMIVLTAALSMNELGVSLAIVRWRDGIDEIAPTVVTLAALWSLLLFGVGFLGAPAFAAALGSPDAAPLIRVMIVCVVIDAAAAVPAALLTRYFMQKQRLVADLTSFVLGTVLTLTLAYLGYGAWSMVWGLVLTNVVTGAMVMWLAPRLYAPGLSVAAARELLAFGLPLAGASVLAFAILNVDYVVVGSQLGATQLGFYLLAFNLASWPVSLISSTIRRVSLAGFSRVADNPSRAGEAFARASSVVMAVTVPLGVLMLAYAEPGIVLLYGAKWAPSADALRFLSVLGIGRVAMELAYDYLVAVGRGRANLWIQGLWFACLVPALVVGARVDGIRGVAAGHAVVVGLVVIPATVLVLRTADVNVRSLLRANVRPLLAGIATALSAWAVLALVNLGTLGTVALGGAVAAIVCGAILYPLLKGLVRGPITW